MSPQEIAAAAGLQCDQARVAVFPDRRYLIIGTKRRSEGEWFRNGKPWDFDYIEEKVIASGEDEGALLHSAREYKRLCGLTMAEYLRELVPEVEGVDG